MAVGASEAVRQWGSGRVGSEPSVASCGTAIVSGPWGKKGRKYGVVVVSGQWDNKVGS